MATLKAHGWHVVPNGQTTCARPAPAPTSAAPAFPQGTPISFPWSTETAASGPYVALTDEAVTSEAKKAAGINIAAAPEDVQLHRQQLQRRQIHRWRSSRTTGRSRTSAATPTSPYPTQNSIFNTGGSFNSGGYSDPKMDNLIRNSVFSSDPKAVTKEASYEATALPALFLPNYDYIWAVSKRVGGTPKSYLSADAVRVLAAVLVGEQEVSAVSPVEPRQRRFDARIHHPADPGRDRDHDRDRGDHLRAAAPDLGQPGPRGTRPRGEARRRSPRGTSSTDTTGRSSPSS